MRWCFPARNRIIAALAHTDDRGRGGAAIGLAHHGRDRLRHRARGRRGPRARHGVALGGHQRAAARRRHRHPRRRRRARRRGRASIATRPRVLHLAPRLRALLGEVADGRDTLAALTAPPARCARRSRPSTELELLGHLRRVAGGPLRGHSAVTPTVRLATISMVARWYSSGMKVNHRCCRALGGSQGPSRRARVRRRHRARADGGQRCARGRGCRRACESRMARTVSTSSPDDADPLDHGAGARADRAEAALTADTSVVVAALSALAR